MIFRRLLSLPSRALVAASLPVAVALAGGISVGCLAEEDASDRGDSSIIDGVLSPESQDAVVFLRVRGKAQRGACTGTLVAPNLVLTARHCVAETDVDASCSAEGAPVVGALVRGPVDPQEVFVHIGVDAVRHAGDEANAAARGVSLVHEGAATLCDADIAFVVLDRAVDAPIAPLRLRLGAREGEPLTAVGWGLTDVGKAPTRRLQRTSVAVVAVGPKVLHETSGVGLGASEFMVGEVSCSGDSGGPALSAKGAIVGVVSRGGGSRRSSTNAAASCMGDDVLNVYTHLAEKKELVARAFAAAGVEPVDEGEPPPAPLPIEAAPEEGASEPAPAAAQRSGQSVESGCAVARASGSSSVAGWLVALAAVVAARRRAPRRR